MSGWRKVDEVWRKAMRAEVREVEWKRRRVLRGAAMVIF